MFRIIIFYFLIYGSYCQSGQDLDTVDFNGLQDRIKSPDDIPQIKHWKNNCLNEHGEAVVKSIEDAPDELVMCVLDYVKPDKLRVEVNRSMAKGNLDRVFKKYCGYRSNILSCVDVMLDKFRTCMTPQQLIDVNVTRRAIDAAIDFTCHDDGDRIALFMAEQGVECVGSHMESIKECTQENVPEIKDTMDDPDSLSVSSVVINAEQCGKLTAIHDCIVQETSKCEDPTPANILDALITQMLKVTPCWPMKEQQTADAAAAAAVAAAKRDDDTSSTSGAASHSSTDASVRAAIATIGPLMIAGVTSLASFVVAGMVSLVAAVMSYISVITSANGSLLDTAGAAFTHIKRNTLQWVSFCCMNASAYVSISGVLMILLAGVTAANILV